MIDAAAQTLTCANCGCAITKQQGFIAFQAETPYCVQPPCLEACLKALTAEIERIRQSHAKGVQIDVS